MGFRQILAAGAFALEEIGNGVQPQTVHAHVQPEIHGFENRLFDRGMGKIQIRLMGIKSVPVVSFGHRVPCPIGSLEVFEDDARFFVLLLVVAPDVVIALLAARTARAAPVETTDVDPMCD